jgi:hypothetical protein
MTKQTAQKIVSAIVEDLSDRRGLRQEWEQIDEEIQAEIKQTWAGIILSTGHRLLPQNKVSGRPGAK